ncbi:Fungalysin/Thermolysin Extracellular metalloproteinase 5, partial [Chytridiales sp. JEL 0842]
MILSTILLAAASASLASAHPSPKGPTIAHTDIYSRSNDQIHHLGRRQSASEDAPLPGFYQPLANYQVNPNYTEPPKGLSGDGMSAYDIEERAMNFMVEQAGVPGENCQLTSMVPSGDEMMHVYMQQTVLGVPVANAVANVNIDIAGSVLSMSSSFVPTAQVQAFTAAMKKRQEPVSTIHPIQAATTLAKALKIQVDPSSLKVSAEMAPGTCDPNATITISGLPPTQVVDGIATAKCVYYQMPDQSLVLSWNVNMQTTEIGWYDAFVDMSSSNFLGIADWKSAMYWNPEADHVAGYIQKREPGLVQDSPLVTARSVPDSFEGWSALHHRSVSDEVLAKRSGESQGSRLLRRQGQTIQVPDTAYGVVPITQSSIATLNKAPTAKGQLGKVQLATVKNPEDFRASPLGWHDIGEGSVPTTFGNNVAAQNNPGRAPAVLNNFRPNKADFQFVFPYDSTAPLTLATAAAQPDVTSAAITNVFYLTNAFHDVLYHYGFTETAGNFQVNNFNKGGKGNDPVVGVAEDGSGTNNANFASPPDGIAGRMNMFLFTSDTPNRDGSLDNEVVIHELTHGLSNRLTGGPANANCLNTPQAGGMGEGWSDMVALLFTMTPQDTRATDKTVGAYVTTAPGGVRRQPYSTSMTTNSLTYNSLAAAANKEVHNSGEVWTTMLLEVYWNMVEKSGFTDPALLGPAAVDGTGKGNVDFLKVLVEGMKLQPCNPTFVQARNAIMAADKALLQGKYQCEIMAGFAKRGMGNGVQDTGAFANNNDPLPGCPAAGGAAPAPAPGGAAPVPAGGATGTPAPATPRPQTPAGAPQAPTTPGSGTAGAPQTGGANLPPRTPAPAGGATTPQAGGGAAPQTGGGAAPAGGRNGGAAAPAAGGATTPAGGRNGGAAAPAAGGATTPAGGRNGGAAAPAP